MKKWSILVLIAIIALLMPVSTASVSAQDEISISKSADLTSATVGDTITYTYTISNSENITLENISLVDDIIGSIDLGGQTSIAAGGNMTATATYIVVEADLPGPLVNTATISGTDPEGNPVTDNATASVELTSQPSEETPAIEVTKSADKATASSGDTITYTYTITNTDNVTISNISLEDDKLGPISDNITLAPGKNITATATYTVSEGDLEQGSIVNKATATGTDPDGNPVTANDTATVELYKSGIQVTKEADRETASFMETITYTYTITNTGNVPLSNVTLADDKIPEVSLSDNVTLAPGESVTATGTHTVSIGDFLMKSTIVNTADVTGVDPQGKLVTASDTATVSISKTLFWKRDILQQSGVPGKGIEKAPGLQKPFNPKSQAAEHAGKKDKPTPEQLQIRESVENQGTEQQLQIQVEVENEAGSGQATQNDDEAGPGKGQIKKNWSSDNQTQEQEATRGNSQNKPDNGKPKKNPKAGK
jgi:uncharacterized repeat protein (TIGR01451 family)